MSYQYPTGLAAEPPRTVHEQEALVAEIHREWSGRDEARLKGLAALTLQANGWTLEMIAAAVGWTHKGSASKAISRTRREIQTHLATRNRPPLPG